jgi:GNAT superfamily N-acetyltransferase
MRSTLPPIVRRSRTRGAHRVMRRRSESLRPPLRPVTIAERPDLRAAVDDADAAVYPPFLLHSELSPLWDDVYGTFPEHQLVLCDTATGAAVAHANCVPLHWSGEIADLPADAATMTRRALAERRLGVQPTALGALQAVVHPAQQGTGLARRPLEALAAHAAAQRLPDVFAPIRPTEKERYPLAALDDYAAWVRADGLAQDPWIRVHQRLGATPAGVVSAWSVVDAPLEDWAAWTGMAFPVSGRYVVPRALVPIAVDAEAGAARYEEPHLWMHYRIPVLPDGVRASAA